MTEPPSTNEDNRTDEKTKIDNQTRSLVEQICSLDFEEWFRERQYAQNIKCGNPHFNAPSPRQEPTYHTPSKLNQCHRKIYYNRLNAPKEQPDPMGRYWFGTEFEKALAMDYLNEFTGPETYVRNSLWIDCNVETEVGELQFKGETDPTIVDEEGKPILPSEIKTTGIDQLTEPKTRHLAQVHAYLLGLSQKYDRNLTDAVILYTHRETFKSTLFHVEFDPQFWHNTVLAWAQTQTEYRNDDSLPPANPEREWECAYCDYKHRCGRSDANYQDTEAHGLLPLFAKYPRAKLEKYLEANVDAKLTPTLGHQYPDLATQYGVYDWQCIACESTYQWETVEWTGNVDRPPLCPECQTDGLPAPLKGPTPSEQEL